MTTFSFFLVDFLIMQSAALYGGRSRHGFSLRSPVREQRQRSSLVPWVIAKNAFLLAG
jgi:hypothetical protein